MAALSMDSITDELVLKRDFACARFGCSCVDELYGTKAALSYGGFDLAAGG